MAKRPIAPVPLQAAVVVVERLKQGQGAADTRQLTAALKRRGFEYRHLGPAVRFIRDQYGTTTLVCEQRGSAKSPLYVMNSRSVGQVRNWLIKMLKRAKTEVRHAIDALSRAAAQGVVVPQIRRAKRYAENAYEEIEEALSVL